MFCTQHYFGARIILVPLPGYVLHIRKDQKSGQNAGNAWKLLLVSKFKICTESTELFPIMTDSYAITGHVTRRGAQRKLICHKWRHIFPRHISKCSTHLTLKLDTLNCDTHDGRILMFVDDQTSGQWVINKFLSVKNLLPYISMGSSNQLRMKKILVLEG